MTRNYCSWLDAFVEHAKIGEAPEHLLWWVGVSTIAGALRRRVWIDEVFFQWTPNFYIVVVAPPGIVAKSTTANIGFNLLDDAGLGVHFGPDITSWQALITEMQTIGETYMHGETNLTQHAITCAIDEFGTFFDPEDREMMNALIRLYDGKASNRAFRKITKTQGSEEMHGPWVNIFGCTTPSELNYLPQTLLGGGLFSRMLWLRATKKRQRTAFLSRAVAAKKSFHVDRAKLVADLQRIGEYVGPYTITEAAYEWGTKHYNFHWDKFEGAGEELQGYPARKQTHMFKLAMVISASRGHFPLIDVDHLVEADARLSEIEPDISKVLATVGSAPIPKAAVEIVEIVRGAGGTALRRDVFGAHFYRRLTNKEFSEALTGAIGAGKLTVEPSAAGAVLKLLEKPS